MRQETVGNLIDAGKTRVASSSISSIRAGIVGAGLMGRWHARAVKKAGGKVVSVMDHNLNQANRLAAMYSNAQSFDNLEKMIDNTSLDVLHVCSPTSSHQKIAELAIKAGVNLLVEKPISLTEPETVSLYDLASSHGILICPVHQFVFQDGVRKAKEQLNCIGRPVHIQASICSAGGTGLSSNQLDRIAVDILPHPLSLMQTFLAENLPTEDWVVIKPCEGELRLLNCLRDISLSIFISMNSRPTTNSFQIAGTEGTIHLDLFHGYSVIESGKVSKARKVLHPFDLALRTISAATVNLGLRAIRRESAYPGLERLVNDFYTAIKEGKESPIKPDDAITVARIRDFVISSAGIGQLASANNG